MAGGDEPKGRTALLVVDVQRHLLSGPGAVPDAEGFRQRLSDLLAAARAGDVAVIHVQRDGGPGEPDERGSGGWELAFAPTHDEPVVHKAEDDTFHDAPGLAQNLVERGVHRVVVAGLQSELCVAATARGARAAGFEVVLASGAHATNDDGAAAADISRRIESELQAEGVEVIPHDELF